MSRVLLDIQATYGSEIVSLYKAKPPFMVNDSGIGLQGVLLYDKAEDKVQCSLCGEWMANLAVHIKSHKIKADKYKEQFGLNKSTPLSSVGLSKQRRELALRTNPTRKMPVSHGSKNVSRKHSVQTRNKFATCDAQMAQRFIVLCLELGHYPFPQEIESRDGGLWNAIKKYDSTLVNFYKKIKFDPKLTGCSLDIEVVEKVDKKFRTIAKFRSHQSKRKLPPKQKNFADKKLLATLMEQFGSWNRAVQESGLFVEDALS